MRKTLAIIFVAMLLATNLTSAFVFRNVTAEREAEWQKYLEYKDDYIKMNDLKGFEDYIDERAMKDRFGFYPASRYTPPYDAWQAKYNPPLQGEAYSTTNRPYASSLEQPSAVRYWADTYNSHYVGFVNPDSNGIYFDHPSARTTYGYLTTSYAYGNGYGYTGCAYGACNDPCYDESCGFYARIADQVTDDFYIVRFY